jgi:hypothetical protein
MAWVLVGGAVLCLAPCVGAVVVSGLLAFHEWRARTNQVGPRRAGRRASTDLFDEYLVEEGKAERLPRRGSRPRGALVMAQRADPTLLYECLEERRPRAVRRARRTAGIVAGRAGRPTRLVPLTVEGAILGARAG